MTVRAAGSILKPCARGRFWGSGGTSAGQGGAAGTSGMASASTGGLAGASGSGGSGVAGMAGAAGSGGMVGGAAGGGNGGAPGVAGAAGIAGAAGTGGTAGGGGTAGAASGPCTASGLTFCTDFEAQTVDTAPTGMGLGTHLNGDGTVTVDGVTAAHSGSKSIRVNATGYQTYMKLTGAAVFPASGKMFVRVYLRLAEAMTGGHNTYFEAGLDAASAERRD